VIISGVVQNNQKIYARLLRQSTPIIGFYCIEVALGVSSDLRNILTKKNFCLITLPVLNKNDEYRNKCIKRYIDETDG